MTVDEMTVDEMTVDEMTVDEMTVDEMTVDEMTKCPHSKSVTSYLKFKFSSNAVTKKLMLA
jgi:hypothetical protein